MNSAQSNQSKRSPLSPQNRFRPRGAIWWLSMALLGMAALFLAGCSDEEEDSSSGSSESFVISINGAADITFSDSAEVGGVYATTEVNPDFLWADSTAIVAGGFGTPPGGLVTADGSSTGTFNFIGGNAYMSYTVSATLGYVAADGFGTIGSVTITQYGSVGGYIEGTFTVTDAVEFVSGSPSGATVTLDGSFSVIREADDTFF